MNPYIKRFPDLPKAKQLELLAKTDPNHICAYPSKSHLRRAVDRDQYRGKPFTLALALGEAQLAYRAFELSVLESYRNDPRYYYSTDDIGGRISIPTKQAKRMRRPDQNLLQSFGFAYDDKFNRAVVVFLRYLADMTPEHQQIWHAKRLRGHYKLHPDYYRSSIVGDWPTGISVFDACLQELKCVNDMCNLLGRPPLFREEYQGDDKPRDFAFLIRPTLREFNDFVHLLDKMLSENIDIKFFQDEISPVQQNGTRKGTIQMLDDWIGLRFHTPDPTHIDQMISTLRAVRQLRQKPAHAVDQNRFCQKYFKRQRELMIEVYRALQTLRLMFAKHPKASKYKVPEMLAEGPIWTQ